MNQLQKIDECEFCGQTQVTVTLVRDKDWMCSICLDKESRVVQAVQKIESAHKTDDGIQSVADIMLSRAVPIFELKAAIDSNPDIPLDQKNYVMVQECERRVIQFQQAMSIKRQELSDLDTDMKLWQVNGQVFAGKLSEQKRAEFTQFDVNYAPKTQTSKSIRTVAGETKVRTKKSFDKTEVNKAAKEYGISATDIQMAVTMKPRATPNSIGREMCEKIAAKYNVPFDSLKAMIIARGMTAENAAKELVQIGLTL